MSVTGLEMLFYQLPEIVTSKWYHLQDS